MMRSEWMPLLFAAPLAPPKVFTLARQMAGLQTHIETSAQIGQSGASDDLCKNNSYRGLH